MLGKRILVVEDEPKIAESLICILQIDGFNPTRVPTISEARQAIRKNPFSAIVLDVNLPDGNGFDFCKELRQSDDTPILFLTLEDGENDRILGLDYGADDYVTKPFSPREVSSRIKAILRRVEGSTPSKSNSLFHPDEDRKRITFKGKVLDLTRQEYSTLSLLLNRPGHVYSRRLIIDLCWKDNAGAKNERTVDSHIKTIRRKLADIDPKVDPRDILKTHIGMGYSLEG
jgi:two-component system catabolic regulation response regulator CreB